MVYVVVCFCVSCVFGDVTLNQKDDGFRGIWYSNSPSGDEYVYKYGGGLGTYCSSHQPFAVYCGEVGKTFFCYGGTTEKTNNQLLHEVSFYDHKTGRVAAPTIILDKQTDDAHDNPVISVDDKGYIWVFSTSHGTSRPSYIHKSKKPYDIEEFEKINPTRIDDNGQMVAMDNFSYLQVWHQKGKGFLAFVTRYKYPVDRTICFMESADGVNWSRWQRLSTIEKGSYQISCVTDNKAGSAFNIHPLPRGLDYRTNLYYVETTDCGKSWHSADGKELTVPLTVADKTVSSALVRDYEKEGLKVYIQDMVYDIAGNPVILYTTSGGWRPGPENGPRTWTIAHWKGDSWQIRKVTTSDNNYDMGSLYIEADGKWRLIGPTEKGPQEYNTGGEIAMWISGDHGNTWTKEKDITTGSKYNHTYVRRPVNANEKFYGFWADGDGRKMSESRLYFCDKQGNVTMLPQKMDKKCRGDSGIKCTGENK